MYALKTAVIIIVTVAMFLWGAYEAQKTLALLDNSLSAEGTVTEMIRSTKHGYERRSTKPKVLFRAEDGNDYEFTSEIYSDPPKYKVGEKVQVLYPPDSPENARISSFMELWGPTAMTGGFGLIFLIIIGCELKRRFSRS